MDAAIAEFLKSGVDEEALERAKTRLVAEAIYAQDNQASLARWYGAALATGSSVADVEAWPNRIDAVTTAMVKEAAAKWLSPRRSVTGFLLPQESETEAEAA